MMSARIRHLEEKGRHYRTSSYAKKEGDMMSVRIRHLEEKVLVIVMALVSTVISLMLILIVGEIFIRSLPSLTTAFIFTAEADAPGVANGILNALMGTIIISICSVVLATPISIGTAIYLARYATSERAVSLLRFFIDVMSGTPSIVLGIFGMLFLAYYMKPITGGLSLFAGSIALAILITPTITRSVEEAIHTVPTILEEASIAMGADKWQTIARITLPFAMSGIITGIILGVGRAAEESAVVMLTAGYTQHIPWFSIQQNDKLIGGIQILPLQDMIASLPAAVYHSYELGYMVPESNGFAAAIVLIVIVMSINAAARLILWRWKIN